MVQLGGHGGERKEEEVPEDFTRREKHHFGLHDLEVMETLGEYSYLVRVYKILLLIFLILSCT